MNPLVTPLRYPGGKASLVDYVEKFIESNKISVDTLIEPYAGSAAVSIGLLNKNIINNFN